MASPMDLHHAMPPQDSALGTASWRQVLLLSHPELIHHRQAARCVLHAGLPAGI